MNILLRRRKLGNTSCREISARTNIITLRNDKIEDLLVEKQVNYLFRWGCTSSLTDAGVMPARHTVNKAEAISLANDKKATRLKLAPLRNKDKPIIPKTYGHIHDWAVDGKKLPVIVRADHHAQGRSLFFCNTEQEISQAILKLQHKNKDYYISEYIAKEAEYRVFIAQNRVVWVTKKTPANPADIAWNVAQGGRFDNVRFSDWPLKACRIALMTVEAVGLDFGGVDVMQKDKDFYVLEVNSAPSMTSEYRQTTTAKVFQHIVDNGNITYPSPVKLNSYKDCIHPCLL